MVQKKAEHGTIVNMAEGISDQSNVYSFNGRIDRNQAKDGRD